MPRSIGIGVIGMGWMGVQHSRSYRQIAERFPDCALQPRLIACADDVKSRTQDARDRLGFERCTTEWLSVVNDPEIEVINIASPNFFHLEMARRAQKPANIFFARSRWAGAPRRPPPSNRRPAKPESSPLSVTTIVGRPWCNMPGILYRTGGSESSLITADVSLLDTQPTRKESCRGVFNRNWAA